MYRYTNTTSRGGQFDERTIEAVWNKAKPIPGYSIFRKDCCNSSIQRNKYGKTEQYGWEIDHITPVSRGGSDDLSNLQPLQWENNRYKGDNYPNWSCKIRL